MHPDVLESARAEIERARAFRARQLAAREELQRTVEAVVKPIYILKNKRQLEFRLQ